MRRSSIHTKIPLLLSKKITAKLTACYPAPGSLLLTLVVESFPIGPLPSPVGSIYKLERHFQDDSRLQCILVWENQHPKSDALHLSHSFPCSLPHTQSPPGPCGQRPLVSSPQNAKWVVEAHSGTTLSTLTLRGLMLLPPLWVNLRLSVFCGGGQVFRVEGQVCILPQFTQLGYVSTVTLSFIFCHLCHLIVIRVPPLVEGEWASCPKRMVFFLYQGHPHHRTLWPSLRWPETHWQRSFRNREEHP